MPCKYYRKYNKCAKNNDEYDLGDCIYNDGIINEKASIHCSEGREKLGLVATNFESTTYKKIKKD